MIDLYKKKCESDFLDYISRNSLDNFYLTENNERVFIKEKYSLRKLLKESLNFYISRNDMEINGAILVWKSNFNKISRKYVKFITNDPKILKNLLTVLLWHTNSDLYIKIDNNSIFIKVLKQKGFQFFRGRGQQILLRRLQHGSYSGYNKNKNKEYSR